MRATRAAADRRPVVVSVLGDRTDFAKNNVSYPTQFCMNIKKLAKLHFGTV